MKHTNHQSTDKRVPTIEAGTEKGLFISKIKYTMKRVIPYILILSLAVFVSSCDKPTEEQKNADALFQKITKVYTLNPDGSMDYQYQHELDLHTHYSFNRLYGETFIVYNPKHQKLEVNRSETETAEGKMVASPDNAFNEVLPRFAAGAPPYHHLREMVVTHTGLEKNSTIFVDYTIHSDAGYKPFMMENTVLRESSPVRELVIKVRFPKDKELNYQLLNAEENLNISNKGEMKEYKWVFEDLDATSKEDNQPEYGEHLPRLIFSTARFNEATSWFAGRFSYDVPPSAQTGLDDILQNRKNRMDSILAIQDMVVNHVNHFNIPLEAKGYSLHSNEQVLENNGGTTFEKTVLLASLLKDAGFEAQPLAIEPEAFYSKEVGDLDAFQDYYVKVSRGNEPVYLSAIEENSYNNLYGHGSNVHLLFDQTEEKVEVETPERFTGKQHLEGTFVMNDNQTIEGEVTATMTNCENPYLQLQRSEGSAKSFLSPGFPASSIKEHTTKNIMPGKSVISYTVEHKLSPKQQKGYSFITIPHTQSGLDHSHLDVLTGERETPFEISWPVDVRYQYTIEMPESVEMITEHTSIERSTDVGELRISIEKSNGKASIDRHLAIDQEIIHPENYESFKEMIGLWKKDQYRTLTFKEKNGE